MARSIQSTAALLGLAAVVASVPLPTARSTSSISWSACPEEYGFPSNLTCANYTVPLDWSRPDRNETIELGMVRLAAADEANRIGYLFINPGGPGGQATSTVASLASGTREVDSELLAKFDIIGLDPRGVGISTPVQCDIATYNKRVSFFPKTQDEFDELVAYNKAVGASCHEKTGRLIDFVDTISAVKDHEAVRQALGGDKATFLGLSYGTQLFSQYAQLYPEGIRAMVLDGNLQRSQSESSNLLIESSTYQATLEQFFSWCNASDECPLQGQDVEAKFKEVLSKAEEGPIPAPGCDDVSCRSDMTAEEMLFNVQGYLISQGNWPTLGEGLVEAGNGNATILSSAQPLAVGDAYEDSYLFAGTAIACQDWGHAATTLADVTAKEALGSTFTPLTQGACQSYKIQTSCIGWPAALTNPPKPVSYEGNTTILMVNSLYDPSTSYTWALGLQYEIKNNVLLTRNGSGHTSWGLGGNTTEIENEYLINLTLPEPGTITTS
ncbi:alpha/beta hydrolase fold-domain-containing protein [Xylariaceae sp. FL0016]|nr:alpha/beta hydrolase fold-domain-containing protein [Xylariaceae sp. FL0016]